MVKSAVFFQLVYKGTNRTNLTITKILKLILSVYKYHKQALQGWVKPNTLK
jgi:hypothetical protein